MDDAIAKRAYYSIGDVCDLSGLKPHVLRYWETQFEVLRPTKNRAGNRVYRPKDVELILLVKHLLYEKRFTIDGARQKLKDMRSAGELKAAGREILGPEFLRQPTHPRDSEPSHSVGSVAAVGRGAR